MDFLTRLVERTLGRAELAQARIVSQFSPQPAGAGRALMEDWQGVEAENGWGDSQGLPEQETFVELPPPLPRPLPVSQETLFPHARPAPHHATPVTGDLPADRPQIEPPVQAAERAMLPAAPTTPHRAAPDTRPPPRRRSESDETGAPRQPAPAAIRHSARQAESPAPPATPPLPVLAAKPASRLHPREPGSVTPLEVEPVPPQVAETHTASPLQFQPQDPLPGEHSISPSVRPAMIKKERAEPGPPPTLVPATPGYMPEAEKPPAAATHREPQPQPEAHQVAAQPSLAPAAVRPRDTHLQPAVAQEPPMPVIPRIPGVAPQQPPVLAATRSRAVTRSQPPASPPTIRVHIGRVEVRAVTPPSAPQPPAVYRTPALSLADYLKRRNEGQR
jgi:hypothetical protein